MSIVVYLKFYPYTPNIIQSNKTIPPSFSNIIVLVLDNNLHQLLVRTAFYVDLFLLSIIFLTTGYLFYIKTGFKEIFSDQMNPSIKTSTRIKGTAFDKTLETWTRHSTKVSISTSHCQNLTSILRQGLHTTCVYY